MCMATRDRRVQVLFDPARYAALEAEATAERQSVAALIREAVDERVSRNKKSRREAPERLLSHPDETGPPIDWEEEKESFEREYLKDLP